MRTAKLASASKKDVTVLPSWPFPSRNSLKTRTLRPGTRHAEARADEALLAPLSPYRHFPRLHSLLLSVLAVLATVALSTSGAAAEAEVQEQSWREPRIIESAQRFALELRFGPYRPAIDDAFPTQRPYEKVFGSDARIAFGLELDWQLLRIPYVGTLGPGIGWSYTHMSAQAYFNTGEASAEETNLAIMPTYGVAVVRFDELARRTVVPLVGYAKAGIGYGIYWTGNEVETQRRGHTWGTHFALGGMFLLDIIDHRSAVEIDSEWGVNNTYVFFEWMVSNLDDFKGSRDPSAMHIGTNTWMLGLAFEM